MKISQVLSSIGTHTGGEPTRTITGGIPHIPGRTIVEKMTHLPGLIGIGVITSVPDQIMVRCESAGQSK
jgi:hypothetical protein